MELAATRHMKYGEQEMVSLGWVKGKSAAVLGATLASASCVGLPSGIDYPDVSSVDLDDQLLTPEGNENPSVTLSEFKFSPRTCEKLDLRIPTRELDQEDLTRFFSTAGVSVQPKKARGDLYWYEFGDGNQGRDNVVRLRLAVLKDRYAAAKDLHDSLLQHGPGWWGLRRGNLALLMPKASLREALRFAIKYKLVCWGMFTYAGVDDAYVVSGAYTEF